jgi:hypothetical protein
MVLSSSKSCRQKLERFEVGIVELNLVGLVRPVVRLTVGVHTTGCFNMKFAAPDPNGAARDNNVEGWRKQLWTKGLEAV